MEQAKVDFRLLFVTDRERNPHQPLSDTIRALCEAGVRAVQLREKDVSSKELFELARHLRRLTDDYEAALLINDRIDIALAVGADGVHCPENGMPIDTARRLLGTKRVGFSAHSLRSAQRAAALGADYVIFGPVYSAPSKAHHGQGIARLREVCEQVSVPVYAIGGVDAQRAVECLQAGAAGVAVISALTRAKDTAGAVREFETALGEL